MPSLELLAAPPGTGKTFYCVERFREEILRSKNGIESRSYFVLPNLEHTERIQNLVLRKDVCGLFNAHILTINDLADKIVGEENYFQRPSDSDSIRVLKQILDANPKNKSRRSDLFQYFQDVKDRKGFILLLADVISEFRASLLSIKEFEKRSQNLLKDPVFRLKFRDFSIILKRYQQQMKALGFKDPETALKEIIRSKKSCQRIELIIFDGFYHFTMAQKQLIRHLTKCSKNIIVTLTLSEPVKKRPLLFDYAESTRAYLKKIGFKQRQNLCLVNHRTQDRALIHLEKNLFVRDPDVMGVDRQKSFPIRVLEGARRRQEVEMIARKIKAIYREQKLYLSDICLILRHVAPYENIIQSVFEEFEIPVFIHERRRLIRHGLGRLLYRWVDLVFKNWRRDDLFSLWESTLLNPGISEEALGVFEKLALANNVREGRLEWERLIAGKDVPQGIKEAFQFLSDCSDGLQNARNFHDFKKSLYRFLKRCQLGSKGDDFSMRRDEDLQVYNAIANIIEMTAKYQANRLEHPLYSARVSAELQDLLETALYSVDYQGDNRVQVYDAVMALPKEYKIVFMAGLVEGQFPKSVREDPLFKDHERRRMNRKGLVLEERSRRRHGEGYFFYMGLTRAREALYLSYPLFDSEEKETLPSFFVESVKKCFSHIPSERLGLDQLLPDYTDWSSHSELYQGALAHLSGSQSDSGSQNKSKFLSQILKEDLRHDADFQAILTGALTYREEFEKGGAQIHDSRIHHLLQHRRKIWSPSSLKIFNVCPYQYFASKTLGLAEINPAGPDHKEIGTLLHRILQQIYQSGLIRTILTGEIALDRNALKRLVKDLIDEALKESPLMKQSVYKRHVYRLFMQKTLENFIGCEQVRLSKSAFLPKYFETTFGFKGPSDMEGLPCLRITHEKGDVLIQGKIDRMDCANDNQTLIIDYKSSLFGARVASGLKHQTEIQLPVYVLAATQLLGLDVIGAEYRYLSQDKTDGFYKENCVKEDADEVITGKDGADVSWDGLLKRTEALICEIDRRYRQGDIALCPKTCRHCPYDGVCRFEKWKLIYDNSSDDNE